MKTPREGGRGRFESEQAFAVRPHPSSWPAPNKVTKSLFLEHVLIESWPWVSSQVRSHHTSVPTKVRLTQGLFAQAPHTGGERSTDGLVTAPGHNQWSSPRGAEDFYQEPIRMHIQALASSCAGQKQRRNIILDQGLVNFKGSDSKYFRRWGPHRIVSVTTMHLCCCLMKAAVNNM